MAGQQGMVTALLVGAQLVCVARSCLVQLTDRAHSHKSNLLCPGMDNSFIVATNGIQTLLLISSYCPFLSSSRVYGSAIYQSSCTGLKCLLFTPRCLLPWFFTNQVHTDAGCVAVWIGS